MEWEETHPPAFYLGAVWAVAFVLIRIQDQALCPRPWVRWGVLEMEEGIRLGDLM